MPNTTSTYEPLVLVDTADLPEEEWLEYRRRGIGGSDAAAILGVSPFATARDLYYDKLKVVSYEDGESNWVQKKVGHLLEDARYIEGVYHCHACLHICGSCGEMIHGTMYPAYDRRGRLVEICEACYRASLEPCAACSVCSICRIIGNAFCHRTSVTAAEGGAR